MNVLLARVDDRLVHGQVVHGWLPSLGATLVVVADADASGNSEQQAIARMAVPAGVEVRFVMPEAVGGDLLDEARPTVVLFRTPVEALSAIRAGFQPPRINLGNLHFEPGKLELRKTFCCSARELEALRAIAHEGIDLEYQPAPDIKRVVVDLAAR